MPLQHVRDLMLRSYPEFFKWYETESRTVSQISILIFRLLEVHWWVKTDFIFPGACSFEQLQNTFWDTFWAISFLKRIRPLAQFKMHVSVPDDDLSFGVRRLRVIHAAAPITTAGPSMAPVTETIIRPTTLGAHNAGTPKGRNVSRKRTFSIYQLLNLL